MQTLQSNLIDHNSYRTAFSRKFNIWHLSPEKGKKKTDFSFSSWTLITHVCPQLFIWMPVSSSKRSWKDKWKQCIIFRASYERCQRPLWVSAEKYLWPESYTPPPHPPTHTRTHTHRTRTPLGPQILQLLESGPFEAHACRQCSMWAVSFLWSRVQVNVILPLADSKVRCDKHCLPPSRRTRRSPLQNQNLSSRADVPTL